MYFCCFLTDVTIIYTLIIQRVLIYSLTSLEELKMQKMSLLQKFLLLTTISLLIAQSCAKCLPDQIEEPVKPVSNSDNIYQNVKEGVSKIGESFQKATNKVQSGFTMGLNFLKTKFTSSNQMVTKNETVKSEQPITAVVKEIKAIQETKKIEEVKEKHFSSNTDFAFEEEEADLEKQKTPKKDSPQKPEALPSDGDSESEVSTTTSKTPPRVILDSPLTCKQGEDLTSEGKCRRSQVL